MITPNTKDTEEDWDCERVEDHRIFSNRNKNKLDDLNQKPDSDGELDLPGSPH